MIKGRLVNGLENAPSEPCDFDCIACIQGKMIHGPFSDGHERATERLGLLHSDVCGPMDVQSLERNGSFAPWLMTRRAMRGINLARRSQTLCRGS